MFKHLLIPSDGSELGTQAVHAGVDFAAWAKARVTIITVSEPFHLLTVDDPFFYVQAQEQYLEATAKFAQTLLAKAQSYAESKGVTADTLHVYDANVYKAILDAAAKGCDLIFMASHGRRGISALLLGSVTNKVVTHSTLPVLVYRSTAAGR
jgi:nucleotide-binding universal stress UspA family protein